MPYTQLYIHIVFATKGRRRLLRPAVQRSVYKYIYDLCVQKKVFVIRIGGWLDHIHLFINLPPTIALSDLMQYIKGASSHYIRSTLVPEWYGWNEEYAAFAEPFEAIETVKRYIMNQSEHHARTSFDEEYKELMVRHSG